MYITGPVIEEVAEKEDCDPLDLPSLYDSIDADAVESCIESAASPVKVQFGYYDYTITIRASNAISIDIDGEKDPLE